MLTIKSWRNDASDLFEGFVGIWHMWWNGTFFLFFLASLVAVVEFSYRRLGYCLWCYRCSD